MAEAREKTSFEAELDSRIASAQEKFNQQHSDLFPQEAVDAADATAEQPTLVPGTETPANQEEQGEGAKEPAVLAETTAPTPQKTEEAAPDKPTKEGSVNWKAVRDEQRAAKREIKRLEAELKALKTAPTAQQQAPQVQDAVPDTIQDDPFGFKAEMNRLREEIKQEQQRTQATTEQQRITQEIAQQEAAYRQREPQYDDALNHVVSTERNRYKFTGDAQVKGKMLMDLADRFSGSREDARIVQQAIDRLVDERDITELEAATEIAADLWIAQQRNLVIQGNMATGRSIPETVMEIAKAMGWSPKQIAQAQAAVQAAPAKPAVSPAEQIRATARASAAGKSLSQLQPAGINVPDGPQIRTVQDWMNFHKSNPTAAREYAKQMSARDPRWHLNLASR